MGTISFEQLYVLFMIALSTREVHILGVSEHPIGEWVTQVAHNLVGDLVDRGRSIKFLAVIGTPSSLRASTRYSIARASG